MTTLYFNVKGGLQTGNIILDAATGNITGVGNADLGNLVIANYFQGNGSALTGLNASNLASGTISSGILGNSTVYIGTTGVALNRSSASLSLTGVSIDGSAGSATTAGTVTTNAQPNITSTGTLSSLDVTANVTAGNISSQGVINSTGNVTAPFFIGNVVGNISGTITVPGNNTAVLFNQSGNAGASDALTFDYASNTLSVSGNLTSSNANLGNLAVANYISGDGSLLTGLNASNLASGTISSGILGNSTVYVGTTSIALNRSSASQSLTGVSIDGSAATVTTNAQPNITSVGTLVSLGVNGNVDVTGNINVTGNLNYSNVTDLVVGDPLIYLGANNTGNLYDLGFVASYNDGTYVHTGLARNHNDGVWTIFDDVVDEPTTTIDWGNAVIGGFKAGNITAGNISGANLISGTYLAGTLTAASAAQPNVTSLGTLTSLTSSGLITATAGGIKVGNLQDTSGTNTIQLTNSDIIVTGNITAGSGGSGNVTATYFIGNGSQLTGVAASTATTAGTVTTNAQPNITSTGTLNGLTVTGTVDFTGASNVSLGPVANVHISGGTSGYLLTTDGAGTLSWAAPASTTSIVNGTSNVNIGTSGGNVTTSVGGTANVFVVDAGGANISGNLAVSGTLTAGNLTTGGSSGNISGANYVIANYFQGDGSALTNLNASNLSSGTISSGILGNSTVYIGTTSVALNRSSGALTLTGINSIDGYAATVSGAAQGNITSVGTLTSVAVTGDATVGNININGGITSNRSNVSVSTNTVIDEFAPSTYRTAKYVVSASNADGYQSAEIILVHNDTTSYISIYGSVCSNSTADIVEFSSNVNPTSGNVTVYATGSSATLNLVATYLKT